MTGPSWKIAPEQVHDREKFRAPASQQGNVPVNDANRIFATADYYARREAQERVLSERATDPTSLTMPPVYEMVNPDASIHTFAE